MDIIEKLLRQAESDYKAGTLYSHLVEREAAEEIKKLREALDMALRALLVPIEEPRFEITQYAIDQAREVLGIK